MKGSSARERENYYNQELMLLGRITGKGKKARDYIAWKSQILDLIRKRTSGIPKKRVLGINSVSKLLNQEGISTWSGKRIIELAGGADLSQIDDTKEISAEWILEKNPEIIILSSYWPEEGLGYQVSDSGQAARTHDEILHHRVIRHTRACKEGHVYMFSYYGTASGGQTALGALYLAKRLYPDQFSDINPATYHKEFFEKWLHIPHQGIWFYP